MRGLIFFAVIALFSLNCNLPALAQQGVITSLKTGSQAAPHGPESICSATTELAQCQDKAVDSLFISLDDQPFIYLLHPCKIKSGIYALEPADSNVKVNEAVLLAAYLSGKRVSLGLDGCVFDMPRIVSVTVD
jgi:hypothetical protein